MVRVSLGVDGIAAPHGPAPVEGHMPCRNPAESGVLWQRGVNRSESRRAGLGRGGPRWVSGVGLSSIPRTSSAGIPKREGGLRAFTPTSDLAGGGVGASEGLATAALPGRTRVGQHRRTHGPLPARQPGMPGCEARSVRHRHPAAGDGRHGRDPIVPTAGGDQRAPSSRATAQAARRRP